MANLGGLQIYTRLPRDDINYSLHKPDRRHLISPAAHYKLKQYHIGIQLLCSQAQPVRQRRLSAGNYALGNISQCFIHLVDENKA